MSEGDWMEISGLGGWETFDGRRYDPISMTWNSPGSTRMRSPPGSRSIVLYSSVRPFGLHPMVDMATGCPTEVAMNAVQTDDEASLIALNALLTDDSSLVEATIGDEPMTLLMMAAAYGATTATNMLLWFEADVNAVDSLGKTALHYAAEWAQDEMVCLLLSRGADPTTRMIGTREGVDDGMTPLMLMASKGHIKTKGAQCVKIIKHLTGTGLIDINERGPHGATAALLVCGNSSKCAMDILRALLDAHADLSIPTNLGITPIQLAREAWTRERFLELKVQLQQENPQALIEEVHRARCLRDAFLTHQALPNAPLPAYVQGRVAAGEPLPVVEIWSCNRGTLPPHLSAMNVFQKAITHDTEVTLVLDYVTRCLDRHLYHELMAGMDIPDEKEAPQKKKKKSKGPR